MTTDDILRFFETGPLPNAAKGVGVQFEDVAQWIAGHMPETEARQRLLMSLLEVKNEAVRISTP